MRSSLGGLMQTYPASSSAPIHSSMWRGGSCISSAIGGLVLRPCDIAARAWGLLSAFIDMMLFILGLFM